MIKMSSSSNRKGREKMPYVDVQINRKQVASIFVEKVIIVEVFEDLRSIALLGVSAWPPECFFGSLGPSSGVLGAPLRG